MWKKIAILGTAAIALGSWGAWKADQIERRGNEAVLFEEAKQLSAADRDQCRRISSGQAVVENAQFSVKADGAATLRRCARLGHYIN
jgi:hypothetical protein